MEETNEQVVTIEGIPVKLTVELGPGVVVEGAPMGIAVALVANAKNQAELAIICVNAVQTLLEVAYREALAAVAKQKAEGGIDAASAAGELVA